MNQELTFTASAANVDFTQPAPARHFSAASRKIFVTATSIWAAATVALMVLFYIGVLDFVMSSRLSMYFISIWLNVWILVWFMRRNDGLGFAERDNCFEARPANSLRYKVIHSCLRTAQTQSLVVPVRADKVCMSVDLEPDLWELADPAGLPGQR